MLQFYQFLHVASAFLLAAVTFKVLAKPDPATRKRNLMVAGIFAFTMLVGGFGLHARLELQWYGWLIGKIVCWVVLASLAGLAYRKPEKTGALIWASRLAVLIAVYLVYFRPGQYS